MWFTYITVLYVTILFVFSYGDPFKRESKTLIWMSSYFIHDTFVSFIDYRKVSNIRHTSVDNNIVDHSDVVGATPVGAAPTTSSFST